MRYLLISKTGFWADDVIVRSSSLCEDDIIYVMYNNNSISQIVNRGWITRLNVRVL